MNFINDIMHDIELFKALFYLDSGILIYLFLDSVFRVR